jgi:membrane protease YdiL (CAAX protease family)
MVGIPHPVDPRGPLFRGGHGRRGLAQPLLQRRMAPFWATLILGSIWAIWHYPAFVIRGTPQDGGSFAMFIVAAMVISLAFTALFNASRGSILIPALFHFQANNPALPDGGPAWVLALVLFVVVIVWMTRSTMFRRDGGATELLMRKP